MTAALALRQQVTVAPRSAVAGLLGAAGLIAVYVGLITIAQGLDHALEQLAADTPFVLLLAAGFGAQLALFAELRQVARRHRSAVAVTAAGTGTSAAAMLACCAHHLVDFLPLLGLSAAAAFLVAYKLPLFMIALAMNAAAVAFMGRRLSRARRACAVAEHHPQVDAPAG
jgi:drug/metabolite transporter (DMT)-like permease